MWCGRMDGGGELNFQDKKQTFPRTMPFLVPMSCLDFTVECLVAVMQSRDDIHESEYPEWQRQFHCP